MNQRQRQSHSQLLPLTLSSLRSLCATWLACRYSTAPRNCCSTAHYISVGHSMLGGCWLQKTGSLLDVIWMRSHCVTCLSDTRVHKMQERQVCDLRIVNGHLNLRPRVGMSKAYPTMTEAQSQSPDSNSPSSQIPHGRGSDAKIHLKEVLRLTFTHVHAIPQASGVKLLHDIRCRHEGRGKANVKA